MIITSQAKPVGKGFITFTERSEFLIALDLDVC